MNDPGLRDPNLTDPNLGIPVREPAQTALDDTILPFEVNSLDLRGRIVRLGPAVDAILTSHDYPLPVAKLLGEAIVLTVMLGSALKFEGRFILPPGEPVQQVTVREGGVRSVAGQPADVAKDSFGSMSRHDLILVIPESLLPFIKAPRKAIGSIFFANGWRLTFIPSIGYSTMILTCA